MRGTVAILENTVVGTVANTVANSRPVAIARSEPSDLDRTAERRQIHGTVATIANSEDLILNRSPVCEEP
jgi:hypothetical protein